MNPCAYGPGKPSALKYPHFWYLAHRLGGGETLSNHKKKNMEQVETLTHRNLTAYLMEAGQDLTVRHRMVFDVQGREVARLESQRECCANCRSCHRIEMWGIKRLVCGDPTQATCVDVAPDGWCKFHEGPAPELGLTMDIWY